MAKPNSIAVLTAGGDAPGMNAAVRAVVLKGLKQLAAALAAGDGEAAAKAMRTHLGHAKRILLDKLRGS